VVNYELNLAQTSAESIRSAYLGSLLSGRIVPRSTFSLTSGDILVGVLAQEHGPNIIVVRNASTGVCTGSRVYSGSSDVMAVTLGSVFVNNCSSVYEYYDTSVGEEVIYQACTDGSVTHVGRLTGSTPLSTAIGAPGAYRSYAWGNRKGNASARDELLIFHNLSTQAITGKNRAGTALTLPSGISGSGSPSNVWIETNDVGGDLFLATNNKVCLSTGVATFTLADTGVGAGYVVRGLTWSESDGYFYLATFEGTSSVIYRRAPAASAWTSVATHAVGAPDDLFQTSGFEICDLVSFGGILVAAAFSTTASPMMLCASLDSGDTWSIFGELTGMATRDVRFYRSGSGAITCAARSSLGASGGFPVWIATPPGLPDGHF
jgi:hypothetical protein